MMGKRSGMRPVMGALQVRRLEAPGLHFVGGVTGLAMQITPSGSRSWILRYSAGGRRRDMGLGSFPSVTLAQARTAAQEARARLREGVDPIDEARAARSRLLAAQGPSFDECARRYIAAYSAGWSNPKHAAQWDSTLATYASPVFGALLVRDVTTGHVIEALSPIWTTKNETASRVRGRIEAVLDWARVSGYREGENPARWRGHLDKLLPARSKVARVKHHKALAWAEMGAFMVRLRQAEGTGARALEFAILTAARSAEVRGAVWSEIDMQGAVWTIDAARMKARREHRVPLSEPALALLQSLPRMAETDLVFPSSRLRELSDATLGAVLKRLEVDATVHGFRSTLRDWAAETTGYSREVAEMALSHAVGSKVEAAYRRGDLFDKRRRLMSDWAAYCATIPTDSATVTPIRARA